MESALLAIRCSIIPAKRCRWPICRSAPDPTICLTCSITLDDEAYNDTLTFGYTSSPYFASEQCGAMLLYEIHSFKYTRHLVDSVAIVDSLITNTDLERIKIYFRTSTDETD